MDEPKRGDEARPTRLEDGGDGEQEAPDSRAGAGVALGISLGSGVGAVLGLALDNVGLWLPVGLAVGSAVGALLSHSSSDDG